MNGPDGIEERTEWQESAYDHAMDALDVREQLADELRDLIFTICRPSCELIGHDKHLTKGYCRFCGVDL